ncbi:hypothetical protein ACWT_7205 [Actinoplanes sp. SE50]|uniref:hypothetical protein n=1 Tax=unclassified Actinoplanes TaxID=2626549 RepID=UPI00023EDEBF|nr:MULTISPECIES: hypothetical protein [unclassified Actinoplanes]AEV88215.1 hypothetical protein ACPL_7335 [Actinoplanes sp. SE50/110]ATO86620.1 hypothetical protein ACWT_7205 [Actinoplanes sp. SE50]SLM04037.1 hypothetical protein ACSP50_7336 [Actinoplanes sp. SE50/110]
MGPALHVIAGPGPGQLATMAHPGDTPWSPPELAALARAGVHILVCTARHRPPATAGVGIELIDYPDPDETAPRREATEMVALATRLAREVRSGRFVVTQSSAELGRTTLLATMTLALLGIRPGEALRRIGVAPGQPVAQEWLHDFVAR